MRHRHDSLASLGRVRNACYKVCNRVCYHDDFRMPGMTPSLANSRKQMRQRSKSRIYPFLRPQRKQRRTTRDLNFGFFFDLAMTDVFAIYVKTKLKNRTAELSPLN